MVLIYGRDIWVVMDVMLKVMEVYHHSVDRRIAGMKYWRVREGGMRVVISRGGIGGGRSVENEGVYLESTGYHFGVYI